MFENQYVMDIKRYRRWTAPTFYKVKSFWPWMVILAIGLYGAIFFSNEETKLNWESLGYMLVLVSVYRAVFFRYMLAGKQFKMMRVQNGMKQWDCKVIVGNTIRLFTNDQPNNEVFWKQVTKCVEAKSYFDLSVDNDFVRLDKNCFTKGDAESFKAWMLQEHPEIPWEKEKPEFDK